MATPYRGRIAPTPTGHLHLGHARTFFTAAARARAAGGVLVYRNEDIDRQRCKLAFHRDAMEDLRWFGIDWQEGPDCGGPYPPYTQSAANDIYLDAWRRLKDAGYIYPCRKSRRDLAACITAPHGEDAPAKEPLYPVEWRPPIAEALHFDLPDGVNWRFRVPAQRTLSYEDGVYGRQAYRTQDDFGDFLIWRRDGMPAYELAVVIDDARMRISEVVRGADLLLSTARQLLIYEALGLTPPAFHHLPLMRDNTGKRLAKRDKAMSLRNLRAMGLTPEDIRQQAEWQC